MRYLVGFVCALALGIMGCSETAGTGGTGGDGGFAGNCGWYGWGGGAYLLAPGLWTSEPVDAPEWGCVYVDEDCSALAESTECDVREDGAEAHLLELEWANGTNDMGEECAAGVSVAIDDLGVDVPVSESFRFSLTDADGGQWEIEGIFISGGLLLEATRTTGDGYCSGAAALLWQR